MGVKVPPCGAILLHLGACDEAIMWAARRSVSAATLAACPSREWRVWLAKHLHVSMKASWAQYLAAIKKALSGYGSGHGSGDGYGYGDGSGYGDGDGYGYGSGDGDGYGSGDGSGSGYGDGSGSGSGSGYGDGADIA